MSMLDYGCVILKPSDHDAFTSGRLRPSHEYAAVC